MPRVQFYDTVTATDPDGTMKALSGVNVTVYDHGASTKPNIYARDVDTVPIAASSFLTVDGIIDFWVDPGVYDIVFEDTVAPARIESGFSIMFNALPAGDGNLPGSFLVDASIAEDKIAQILGSSFAQALINQLFAPGDMKTSYQPADHSGWLLADGRTNLLVSDHPVLGALMQARGFLGIDANHFGVPDYRGRMPVGVGTHADVSALTSNDGVATVANRRPRHKHTVSVPAAGSHSHNFQGEQLHGAGASVVPMFEAGKTVDSTFWNTSTDGSHTHGTTVGPQTGAEPTDSAGFQATNFFIKT